MVKFFLINNLEKMADFFTNTTDILEKFDPNTYKRFCNKLEGKIDIKYLPLIKKLKPTQEDSISLSDNDSDNDEKPKKSNFFIEISRGYLFFYW